MASGKKAEKKYDAFIEDMISYASKNSKKKKFSSDNLSKYKLKLCKKYKLRKIPTDIELLLECNGKQYKALKRSLVTKPSRTIAGVAPIAIMTSPAECPHGKCAMCPGGVGSHFGDVPQSYTGKEPATRRAIRNNYDAYLQVFNRLEQYFVLGHFPQKVELIIMGGTFPARTKNYQEKFITDAFKAMNDFSKMFFTGKKAKMFDIKKFKDFFMLPGDIHDVDRRDKLQQKLIRFSNRKTTLENEQRKNELGVIRCIGMTIETRPDHATLKDCNEMLRLGCTRVELGVQNIDDKVLKKIERGHTVKDTILATARLKDLGFKINYHMMPGLPGMTSSKDFRMLQKLFERQEFQPDMLKIYPAMVMPGTKLEKLYKRKEFKPINTKKAMELIAKFMLIVPFYVRIMRVQRDIPSGEVVAGVDKTNLRQYIDNLLEKKGSESNDIRNWEIKKLDKKIDKRKIDYEALHYEASFGSEFFIYAEYDEKLLGYCRLRFPKEFLRKEITYDSALIRELHVVGELKGIDRKDDKDESDKVQHLGIGKKLLKMAEDISYTYFKKKIVVISGIGAKGYYKKLGYKKEGVYMVKRVI